MKSQKLIACLLCREQVKFSPKDNETYLNHLKLEHNINYYHNLLLMINLMDKKSLRVILLKFNETYKFEEEQDEDIVKNASVDQIENDINVQNVSVGQFDNDANVQNASVDPIQNDVIEQNAFDKSNPTNNCVEDDQAMGNKEECKKITDEEINLLNISEPKLINSLSGQIIQEYNSEASDDFENSDIDFEDNENNLLGKGEEKLINPSSEKVIQEYNSETLGDLSDDDIDSEDEEMLDKDDQNPTFYFSDRKYKALSDEDDDDEEDEDEEDENEEEDFEEDDEEQILMEQEFYDQVEHKTINPEEETQEDNPESLEVSELTKYKRTEDDEEQLLMEQESLLEDSLNTTANIKATLDHEMEYQDFEDDLINGTASMNYHEPQDSSDGTVNHENQFAAVDQEVRYYDNQVAGLDENQELDQEVQYYDNQIADLDPKKEPQTTDFHTPQNNVDGHVLFDNEEVYEEVIGEEVVLDKESSITEEWNQLSKIANESEVNGTNIESEVNDTNIESEVNDKIINSEQTTTNAYDERKEKIERMLKRINSLKNNPKHLNQETTSNIVIKQEKFQEAFDMNEYYRTKYIEEKSSSSNEKEEMEIGKVNAKLLQIQTTKDILPTKENYSIPNDNTQSEELMNESAHSNDNSFVSLKDYDASHVSSGAENLEIGVEIQNEIDAGNLSITRSIPYKETFKRMKIILDLFVVKTCCKICDRNFKNKSHLQEHIESKHCSYPIYFCELCDRQFISSSHRRHHIRKCAKLS